MHSTLLLVLSVLIYQTSAQTRPPLLNPVRAPIINGLKQVHVKLFAQIPDWRGQPSRLNSLTYQGRDLYVCTERSGARIYKITPSGTVSLWFDVAAAMFRATGRRLSMTGSNHGGLRSLAFHHQFARTGLFYISAMEERPSNPRAFRYLGQSPGTPIDTDSVLIEWRYNHATRRVDPTSYRSLLRVSMPVYDHPIKQIVVRWQNIYIAHGDGSVQSAVVGGGQGKRDGLGKILRINPAALGGRPYRIPYFNPFRNDSRYIPEIYALGFRNPHNLCFSRSGELFVTDVGRDNIEEINIVKSGGDYGWPAREGPFRHLARGGLISGIAPLPPDDARNGFIYPNAIVGHTAPFGDRFVGQALAGGCPIENGSPLQGTMLYANFPDGQLYYSWLGSLRRAVVTGPPSALRQGATYRPRLFFDHDNRPGTPPIEVRNFREIVRMDPRYRNDTRGDIRFGQGPGGENYIVCKRNGRIYLVTSTVKGSRI